MEYALQFILTDLLPECRMILCTAFSREIKFSRGFFNDRCAFIDATHYVSYVQTCIRSMPATR